MARANVAATVINCVNGDVKREAIIDGADVERRTRPVGVIIGRQRSPPNC